MKFIISILIAFLALPVGATVASYKYQGTVFSGEGVFSNLEGAYVTGMFSYNTDLFTQKCPSCNDNGYVQYVTNESPVNFIDYEIVGFSATVLINEAATENDIAFSPDGIAPIQYEDGFFIGGLNGNWTEVATLFFTQRVMAPPGGPLDSTALPTELQLEDWELARGRMATGGDFVDFNVTSITSIPIPAALSLFTSTLVLLGFRKRISTKDCNR